jgi:hypothetical protein
LTTPYKQKNRHSPAFEKRESSKENKKAKLTVFFKTLAVFLKVVVPGAFKLAITAWLLDEKS